MYVDVTRSLRGARSGFPGVVFVTPILTHFWAPPLGVCSSCRRKTRVELRTTRDANTNTRLVSVSVQIEYFVSGQVKGILNWHSINCSFSP